MTVCVNTAYLRVRLSPLIDFMNATEQPLVDNNLTPASTQSGFE